MPITKNINDVDFLRTEKYSHLGNVTFFSLTRRFVQDGRYTPTMDDVHKRKLVTDIICHITSLRPPGRFLKNQLSTGGSFELLSSKETPKKIYKVLQKDWEDFSFKNAITTATTTTNHSSGSNSNNSNDFRSLMKGFEKKWQSADAGSYQKEWDKNIWNKNINDVDFTTTRSSGNNNFLLLIRLIIEEGSFTPIMNKSQRYKLTDQIQGYLASLDPPGRFLKLIVVQGQSSHNTRRYGKLPRTTVHEKINKELCKEWKHKNQLDSTKVRSLWNNWKKKDSDIKMANERKQMEKKIPTGTEVEVRFRGKVVGYNPPNYYRIRKLDHSREEEFHENDIPVPVPVPVIASTHSVSPVLTETNVECESPRIKLEEQQRASVDHHSMPNRTDMDRPIKQEEMLDNDITVQAETKQLSPSVCSVPLLVQGENVESRLPCIEEQNLAHAEHNCKSNVNDMDHTIKQEEILDNDNHLQVDEFASTNPNNETDHVVKEKQVLPHDGNHARVDEIVFTCQQQQQKPDRVRSRQVDGCNNDHEEHHRPRKKQALPVKPEDTSDAADSEHNDRRGNSIEIVGTVAIKQE